MGVGGVYDRGGYVVGEVVEGIIGEGEIEEMEFGGENMVNVDDIDIVGGEELL